MSSNLYQQHPERVVRPLSITDGGTGAKTAAKALQNLTAVPAAMIGQPFGITPLSTDAIIPIDHIDLTDYYAVSVSGPNSVIAGRTQEYNITDFSFDTAYTCTADVGVITQENDTLLFTAPLIAGEVTFTVNGVDYTVTVIESSIDAPVLENPVTENFIFKNLERYLVGSAFTSNDSQMQYLSIDYQFSEFEDFSVITLAGNSLEDDINESDTPCFLISDIELSGDMYVRVRYIGDIKTSSWSNGVRYTFSSYLIPVLESEIQDPDQGPNPVGYESYGDEFGNTFVLSDDGSVLVTGDDLANENGLPMVGHVFIFKRINNVWVEQVKIVPSNPINFREFGFLAQISLDKQRIFIIARYRSGPSIYMYETTIPDDYTTLVLKDTITPVLNRLDPTQVPQAGRHYDGVTSNLEYLTVCHRDHQSSFETARNYLNIYHFDGTQFNEQFSYTTTSNSIWINDAVMNSTGDQLLVFLYTDNHDAIILRFTRIGTTWTQTGVYNLNLLFPDVRMSWVFKKLRPDASEVLLANYGDLDLSGPVSVYCLKFTNDEFVINQTIPLPMLNDAGVYYSEIDNVSISSDNLTMVFASAWNTTLETMDNPDGGEGTGIVYIYQRKDLNSPWVFIQYYIAPIPKSGDWFGYGLDINHDGTILCIGNYPDTLSPPLPVPPPATIYTYVSPT